MNRTESAELLQAVARHYPGRVGITRDTLDRWHHDLAVLTLDQAEAAWAEHRRNCPHPATSADLLGAHRNLTDPEFGTRPEVAPPAIHVAPAHEAPEVAHAELAKMRAILGPTTPYRGRR